MQGRFRGVLSHLGTEENIKKCEPFEQLNQKYLLLRGKYSDSLEMLHRMVDWEKCRREYSKGGASIHRGFYSPSSLDLVVD